METKTEIIEGIKYTWELKNKEVLKAYDKEWAESLIDDMENYIYTNIKLDDNGHYYRSGDEGCIEFNDGRYYLYRYGKKISLPEWDRCFPHG